VSVLGERVRVLEVIASRYTVLTDTLDGPSGVRGTGDRLNLTAHEKGCGVYGRHRVCSCAYQCVREFERLMRLLREERHSVWWHVNEYHIRAVTRTVWHCPKCKGNSQHQSHTHKGKSGRQIVYQARRISLVTRHKNVNAGKALKGLEWMAERWGLEREPWLPSEIQEVAA